MPFRPGVLAFFNCQLLSVNTKNDIPHTYIDNEASSSRSQRTPSSFGGARQVLPPSLSHMSGAIHPDGRLAGVSACPPTTRTTAACTTSSTHVIWLAYAEPMHNGCLAFSPLTDDRLFLFLRNLATLLLTSFVFWCNVPW